MRGVASLSELVRRDGAKQVAPRLVEALRLPDDNKDRLRPGDISVRELFEAFVMPVSGLPFASRREGFVDGPSALRESGVETTAFPSIMGEVIAQAIMEGWRYPDLIGDQLCRTVRTKNKDERIVGFGAMDGLKEVKENMPYEETGFKEKYVSPVTAKMGRILRITEEAVYFDRTGQILDQARQLGELAALNREAAILNCVCEKTSTLSYYPAGTATALYADDNSGIDGQTNDNLCASNGLVDWSDINAAELLLAAMVDEKGTPLAITGRIILVPRALLHTARHLTSATELEIATATAAYMTKSPSQFNGYRVLTSPFVAAATADSTTWFLGDFQRQFRWTEIWPIQVLREVANSGEAFLRDTLAAFKVRYFGGCCAIDHRYVIKNTA